MKTVLIPDNVNPWVCVINGVTYSYTAGTSITVPDEVACVIEAYNNSVPKPKDCFVVEKELEKKQDRLIAGNNITISGNTISAAGGARLYKHSLNIRYDEPETAEGASYTKLSGVVYSTSGTAFAGLADIISKQFNLQLTGAYVQAGESGEETDIIQIIKLTPTDSGAVSVIGISNVSEGLTYDSVTISSAATKTTFTDTVTEI